MFFVTITYFCFVVRVFLLLKNVSLKFFWKRNLRFCRAQLDILEKEGSGVHRSQLSKNSKNVKVNYCNLWAWTNFLNPALETLPVHDWGPFLGFPQLNDWLSLFKLKISDENLSPAKNLCDWNLAAAAKFGALEFVIFNLVPPAPQMKAINIEIYWF